MPFKIRALSNELGWRWTGGNSAVSVTATAVAAVDDTGARIWRQSPSKGTGPSLICLGPKTFGPHHTGQVAQVGDPIGRC